MSARQVCISSKIMTSPCLARMQFGSGMIYGVVGTDVDASSSKSMQSCCTCTYKSLELLMLSCTTRAPFPRAELSGQIFVVERKPR